jgi:hypothetical protein
MVSAAPPGEKPGKFPPAQLIGEPTTACRVNGRGDANSRIAVASLPRRSSGAGTEKLF